MRAVRWADRPSLVGGAVRGGLVGEELLLLGVVGVGVALNRDVLAVSDVLRCQQKHRQRCRVRERT